MDVFLHHSSSLIHDVNKKDSFSFNSSLFPRCYTFYYLCEYNSYPAPIFISFFKFIVIRHGVYIYIYKW
jgi:hypothetical protein